MTTSKQKGTLQEDADPLSFPTECGSNAQK